MKVASDDLNVLNLQTRVHRSMLMAAALFSALQLSLPLTMVSCLKMSHMDTAMLQYVFIGAHTLQRSSISQGSQSINALREYSMKQSLVSDGYSIRNLAWSSAGMHERRESLLVMATLALKVGVFTPRSYSFRSVPYRTLMHAHKSTGFRL